MFTIRLRQSISFFALMTLSGAVPAAAQSGSVRGYPAGAVLQQTPYYSTYYPVQYGYAYPPAPVHAANQNPAGQTAYYAPAPGTAAYAAARPAASYTLSPAGGVSAGAEAYAYYGQAAPLNYVAPTYSGYQTRVVQVPVTYYRPYTVYQPGAAAPVTCQRATTGTQCQTQRFRLFACCDWLFGRNSCAGGNCYAAAPRTCYSGTCAPAAAPAPCGTPYYNTVPPATVVPVVPGTPVVPSTVTPPRGIRGILNPSPTIPPPPTRTIVPPAGGAIFPGGTIPGGSGTDGASVPPAISPGTAVPPPSSFPRTSGAAGPSGASYRPEQDAFESGSPARVPSRAAIGRDAVNHQAQGGRAVANEGGPALSQPPIGEPSHGPRRSVQPVPDPAASERVKRETSPNRAPPLLESKDRTAAVHPRVNDSARWGVIPATWPEAAPAVPATGRTAIQPVRRHVAAQAEETWDDTLWRSAAQ